MKIPVLWGMEVCSRRFILSSYDNPRFVGMIIPVLWGPLKLNIQLLDGVFDQGNCFVQGIGIEDQAGAGSLVKLG